MWYNVHGTAMLEFTVHVTSHPIVATHLERHKDEGDGNDDDEN